MVISNLDQQFIQDLGGVYDAEYRFLAAHHEMFQQASDEPLQQVLRNHIVQTEEQLQILDRVFAALAQTLRRVRCDAAAGLVAVGQKRTGETGSAALRDLAIATAGLKVEHYEIASYTTLIAGAEALRRPDLAALLRANLAQEVQTAQQLEQRYPALLQRAQRSAGERAHR
jgi:ferritin-like metal-binding protein YciE